MASPFVLILISKGGIMSPQTSIKPKKDFSPNMTCHEGFWLNYGTKRWDSRARPPQVARGCAMRPHRKSASWPSKTQCFLRLFSFFVKKHSYFNIFGIWELPAIPPQVARGCAMRPHRNPSSWPSKTQGFSRLFKISVKSIAVEHGQLPISVVIRSFFMKILQFP